MAIATVGLFIIISCGGGSTTTQTTTKVNNPPIIVIGDIRAITEGMSVELNASASYDKDGDTLSYQWTQSSGETITLIDSDTATPSFIAPKVSNDSNITIELSLSDGEISVKVQKSILILKQIITEQRHEVMPILTTVSTTNGSVEISYTYNKTPIDSITSGLVLNIFWNSSKLEFAEIKNPFESDYMGVGAIKKDSDNSDSSEATDSYMTISWVNLENSEWIVGKTLPTQLFTLVMKSKVTEGFTQINLATKVDSPSLEFSSKSVIIELD